MTSLVELKILILGNSDIIKVMCWSTKRNIEMIKSAQLKAFFHEIVVLGIAHWIRLSKLIHAMMVISIFVSNEKKGKKIFQSF